MTDQMVHEQKIIDQFTRWAKPFAELPIHAEEDAMAMTLSACAVADDMAVLDVACGPGIVACALAERAGRVTGIDLTPAMIEQARARAEALALDTIDWQVGNATALPFADASFDRVVTRYSFHHMPDPAAALAEMKRVCRPDGRIVVIDATPSAETQAAYDRMEIVRDPSHTSALTLDQLLALGEDVGLTEATVTGYRLDALLQTLADEADMAALTALFEADIAGGEDRIGVGARQSPEGIRFHFPVSIVMWRP
ncbi:MAG TPA: methyltransferase domain-containing protein [Sphingobium sp.]|uniref:class I SAM-dependent methyltransferase n=1 Tax=Sphingobium sp. TaxID=1912891 RepID=UPI002ED582FB